MANVKLIFHGHRWPAAKVSGRSGTFEWHDPTGTFGDTIAVATITTTGRGRAWSTDCALGAWRSFSEMDHDSDEQVAGFIQKYGDPHGGLSASTPISTRYHWLALKTYLKQIGQAWGPPDKRGISRVSSDVGLVDIAKEFMERLEKPFMERGARTYLDSDLGFAIEFRTLHDHMVASAVDMLHRRAPMRACDNCGHWFECRRSTAKTCSSTCRNALLKKGKGTEDGISQEG